ncbi:MAG: M43 family zinc metalloprotease [Bacteroidia bacterium]
MSLNIRHLLPVIGLALSVNSFAQVHKGKPNEATVPSQRTCGTLDHHEFLKQTRPGYGKDFDNYNKMLDDYLKTNPTGVEKTIQNTQTLITIPVVIHVVYKTAAQNISDPQAISQFQVLNDDFQRHNSDTAVGSSFYNVAGRVNFQFCLAQRDPSGNPTTGVVHKATTLTSFSTNDAVKFSAQGGDDAWDVTKYMNIWICNLGTTLLGYGEFPTASLSNTYGLVLNYTCSGTQGTAQAPYNLGRTGTHEFGHCFNLFHIWGDDGTACTGSDQCTDTPNQAGENYGCPALPHTDGCTATAPGVMCMNYMDYVDDACMVMFTAQQCARMLAVVSNPPWNVLQTSNGCTPVVLQALDASILGVTSPTGTMCNPTFTPSVTLKNMGTTALTSCTINYQVDAGTVNTYSWSGNLASLATTVVTLPALTTTVGTHTLTVYTSNPNAGADADPSNDQGTSTFSVIAPVPVSLPFTEGFEGTTFVPTGWTLNNPDNLDTWMRNTAGHKTGVASAAIDNYTNDFTGQIDEIMTPAIDLTSAPSPQLTFQVAYKLYTSPTANPNFSDTLQVLISTDCGQTWTSLYKKFGTALTTTTPTFAASQFTPTATQWRMETVSLGSYASISNAYIKFRNISQYENFLFLDDINISSSIGIKDEHAGSLSVDVWPNPAQSQLSVNILNNTSANTTVNVYSVIGDAALAPLNIKNANGVYNLDLTTLSNGVYMLEVKTDKSRTVKRIVINK